MDSNRNVVMRGSVLRGLCTSVTVLLYATPILDLLMLGFCYFRSYIACATEKVFATLFPTLIGTFTMLVAEMWLC